MPVAFILTVSGTGKSSIDFLSLIKDPEDDILLATMKFRSVLITLPERKSVALPGNLKVSVCQFAARKNQLITSSNMFI